MLIRWMMPRIVTAALAGALTIGAVAANIALAAPSVAEAAAPQHEVDLMLQIQPTKYVIPGMAFTDTINIVNNGTEPARDVVVTIPFDSTKAQLDSVTFDRGGAYVTTATPGQFTASIGRIGSHGESVRMTVMFATTPSYSNGAELVSQAMIRWRNSNNSLQSANNDLLLIAQSQPAPASSAMVNPNGLTNILDNGFAPDESVVFWLNGPNNTVLPMYINKQGRLVDERREKLSSAVSMASDFQNNRQYVNADNAGEILLNLQTDGLTPGAYTLVAHGLVTGQEMVTPFMVK